LIGQRKAFHLSYDAKWSTVLPVNYVTLVNTVIVNNVLTDFLHLTYLDVAFKKISLYNFYPHELAFCNES